ncbi:class I SAM-dependent methyltransferase [Spongiibacter sp. KMU-158]|uniref:Class I SAM-dependent methyltransferase n=1 Tax=Spongiibacter pelagi TaxID=2760804 RepID=A0A927C084_9GAMM|nr:class I SAM-dependent methyltransferase [Spongiibacter pelagi]MBD2857632.1 class I SAM-dependent methyltransferase [Spongiibacter pelagi]
MSFYENRILPYVIDKACSMPMAMEFREKIVPLAEGVVLEVGMGSGINLPLYNTDKVEFVWGLEPSEGMRRKAQPALEASPVDVRWLGLKGEEIPLEDNSVDTIVLTYTLCTIPDWETALKQMQRVLKPEGRLLFCEHGLSPDEKVGKWQNRITPVWKKFAGGCHLNRPIATLLESVGFVLSPLDNEYAHGAPKFVGYMYYGCARHGS